MMAEINPLYPITELTQEQYDALEVKDANTLYAIPYNGVLPKKKSSGESKLECVLMTQEEYDGLQVKSDNLLYCVGNPGQSYDETKITVALLNENDEPGEIFGVYGNLPDAQNALVRQAATGNRFYVHIGENAGITTMGATGAGGQGTISGITSPFRVRIPQSVTAMNINTFSNSTGLMMPVILPENLTTIGNSAFGNCQRLTSVTIPGSVTSIHEFAFYSCANLTEITINKPSGSISGAPWGATNATVVWTG